MRYLLVIGLLAVVGCGKQTYDHQINDQCLRRETFRECMERLPKGPDHLTVTGNDWAETVEQCRGYASSASLRRQSTVKPECRSY